MNTSATAFIAALCGAIVVSVPWYMAVHQRQREQQELIDTVMMGKVAIAIQAAEALKVNNQATLSDFANYMIDDGESASSRLPKNGYSDFLVSFIKCLPVGVRAKAILFPRVADNKRALK